MAQGDLVVFNTAKEWIGDGTFDLDDSGDYTCAVITDAVTPSAASVAPTFSDFTDVTSAGTYTAGGTTLAVTWVEAAGTVTFDSSVNPTWAQDASNDTAARWGIIYRDGSHGGKTDACLCFVDLGGTVNMTSGDLTITWNGSGVFTLS